MEFQVEKNITKCIENEEVLGYVTYPNIEENIVLIDHTVVLEKAQGKGIASSLLKHACTYFLKNQIRVKVTCSYAQNWFLKHVEYSSLLVK